MFIIGIDPGISGAICFFESDIIKDVIEMPVMADGKKNKRQINGPQIVNEIQKRIENIPKKNIFPLASTIISVSLSNILPILFDSDNNPYSQ